MKQPPLHIWILPSAFHPHIGGVEEATLQLSRELQRQGHNVLVVTNRYPVWLPETDTVEGVAVRRLAFDSPRRSFGSTAAFARSAVQTLRALWRAQKPDILHVNCASSQMFVATAFSRLRRVPLVLTTHGEVDMDADRVFQKSGYARLMLRFAARSAAALTACSEWAVVGAARIAPDAARAVVVPNGIEPAAWVVAPEVPEPVAAAWGRHVEQKGFDLLIDAWPLVRARHPSARLLLGGDGRETAALKRKAGEGVEFRGAVDRAGVQRLLNESRIAVVPSRIEPFGIVALEAMAAGRPVVWSVNGGLREATGGLGWPADPEDSVALADAVVAAFAAPYEPTVWRAHAEGRSWCGIARRYLAIYQGALRD